MNTEQLVEKLILWVRDEVLTAGCRGVVVGMSGGVDFSVLGGLCEGGFFKKKLGVILALHSSGEGKGDAPAGGG